MGSVCVSRFLLGIGGLGGGYLWDNVKFGLLAFITMLLGCFEFREIAAAPLKDQMGCFLTLMFYGLSHHSKVASVGSERNVVLRKKLVVVAQVGDGDTDHLCWQRPEDMTTSRRAYKLDEENPGSEVAAETAAWQQPPSCLGNNPHYSTFYWSTHNRGKYDKSIGGAKGYYTSVSGYMDELLWAALWLYKATDSSIYLNYALQNALPFGGITWAISEFSWDVSTPLLR
ncbi:UNVERIFIED_CONTAM: Endoglucanase 7 [Sesamum latifolium]|uniref:cellulase n=1 Tax=Sesamum latifolium TaxID=2727402 RepID=A0AAW2WRG6_9LAMI